MTSVQNLLLPLSGNRQRTICLLAVCVFSFYGINKVDAQQPAGKGVHLSTTSQVRKDSIRSRISFVKRDHFNVALLLPFTSVESLQIDTEGQSHINITPENALAIQYYQGALLALDSLRKNGIKLKIFTLDDGADSTIVRKIFDSGIIDSMDVILGPVYNSSLKVAAKLAKEKNKLLISPFSASENITHRNLFYVSANPTLSRHCYEMLSYFDKHYSARKIFILYNSNSYDTSAVNLLKKASVGFKNMHLIFCTDKSDTNYWNISSRFTMLDTNLIIIPSMDEDFVGTITKALYDQATDYPMVVFGMPTWDDFETIRLDYLSTIHCLITDPTWCDKSSYAWRNFEKNFNAEYHCRPLERNVIGYDQMMMVSSLLQQANSDSLQKVIFNVSYRGLAENFSFTFNNGAVPNGNDPDFIENSNVHILQFKNNSLTEKY